MSAEDEKKPVDLDPKPVLDEQGHAGPAPGLAKL
jgi:hypothetical protein